MPLVISLLCGILELGWIFSNKLLVENICREGTRFGIVYSADSLNTQLVQDRISALAGDRIRNDLVIQVGYSDSADYRSGDIVVTVGYPLPTLTPIIGFLSGDTFYIESTSVMKMG
jgi:hypothetical protein